MDYLEIYEAQQDIIDAQDKLIRKMTKLLIQHDLIDDIENEMEVYHERRNNNSYK